MNARERCLSVFESLTRTADDGIVASGLYGGGVGTHVVEVVASYNASFEFACAISKCPWTFTSRCLGVEHGLTATPAYGLAVGQSCIGVDIKALA